MDESNFYKIFYRPAFNVLEDTVSPQFFNLIKFLLTQNPINMAIGTGLGFAFTTSTTKIIDNLITPSIKYTEYSILKLTGGSPEFPKLNFNIYGTIEQIVIMIVFIVFLYYAVVLPINTLKKKYNIDQKTKACQYCKVLIDPSATRCPSCTSHLKEEQM